MARAALKIFALALLIGALATPAVAAEKGGLRYTITVTKFENRSGWHGHWDIGDAWGAVMTDLLTQTGRFIVLGESDMRGAALAEQDFAASGRTAGGRKAPVRGQMTPAQLLVKGTITHVQRSTSGGKSRIRIKRLRIGGKKDSAEVNATIYVVDSTTGQVVASQSVVGKSTRKGGSLGFSGRGFGGDVGAFKKDNVGKAVEAAVAEAVDWITGQLEEIPWTGTVALVRGNKVYVNRGKRENVHPGQAFLVGEAEVIRDPDTGEILDESLNEVARLRADVVKEKLSICSVTSGSADAVEKGMAVHVP
jgi:curli biogenesis system outer membrane secretion channel CsgG